MKTNIPNWGETWYNPNAMANILNFARMAEKYKIAYNLKQNNHSFAIVQKLLKNTQLCANLRILRSVQICIFEFTKCSIFRALLLSTP